MLKQKGATTLVKKFPKIHFACIFRYDMAVIHNIFRCKDLVNLNEMAQTLGRCYKPMLFPLIFSRLHQMTIGDR